VKPSTLVRAVFSNNGGGHLAVISSIAGTKGLGVAPAYSATKRFQNTYIDALEPIRVKPSTLVRAVFSSISIFKSIFWKPMPELSRNKSNEALSEYIHRCS